MQGKARRAAQGGPCASDATRPWVPALQTLRAAPVSGRLRCCGSLPRFGSLSRYDASPRLVSGRLPGLRGP